MPRKRVPYTRPEGKRDARLIIIETEGRKTEPIYFRALRDKYSSSGVHVEIIERKTDSSNPAEVMNALDKFADKYKIAEDDELWMVIDRDYQAWNEKEISFVARQCHQKKGYNLGLSNPAFELWLLLHVKYINDYSDSEKNKLFKNSRYGTRRTYLEKELSEILPGGYEKSRYNACYLIKHLDIAIKQAKELDTNPHERWPNKLGTRVYRLAKKIKKGK
ncbi:MAG: RloB family protein [Bacteroidales bacterium]